METGEQVDVKLKAVGGTTLDVDRDVQGRDLEGRGVNEAT